MATPYHSPAGDFGREEAASIGAPQVLVNDSADQTSIRPESTTARAELPSACRPQHARDLGWRAAVDCTQAIKSASEVVRSALGTANAATPETRDGATADHFTVPCARSG